jgi:hypothetical protein
VPVPHSTSLFSRLSPLAALVLALSFSAGCHVGESPGEAGGGVGGSDAGGGAGGDDGADDGEPPPAADGGGGTAELCASITTELPIQEETHPPGYDYSAAEGQGCLGNCHRDGAIDTSAGFVWTAGGSLFSAAADPESPPVAGATIVIEDAEGTVHTAVTSENGQFWFTAPIAYPARTYACPPEIPMAAMLMNEEQGNCNAGATCHAPARPVFLTVAAE